MVSVNTDLPSANALRNLSVNQRRLDTTFQRLSSGLRINGAKDDAAGLGVAENLNMTYRGVRQAIRNANDGLSILAVTEGAANEVANIVKRLRELAIQSSSGTLGSTERAFINLEYLDGRSEIDRIAQDAEFNGAPLGVANTIIAQVGTDNTPNDQIGLKIFDLSSAALTIGASDVSSVAQANAALPLLDQAMNILGLYRAEYGSKTNRFDSAVRNLETYSENLLAGEARIRDANFAEESANNAKYQVIRQSGIAVLAQTSQLNQAVLRLVP